MGKIKFKKPDIKGCFGKLKSLKWADMKNGIRAMKKRQAEKEAAYRNSRFAQKMQKLYPYMNRYSLILHGIWAIAINFSDRGNVPSFCGGGNFVFACFHEGISV